ncbi:CAP domain-containing protein [Streptomyces sp. NPDC051133]|uniref:CAP domain-containing protein n=1 Tax=Streptomyces sp. NPDC051133 TaxID=3155521 RepID=UPI00341EC1BE
MGKHRRTQKYRRIVIAAVTITAVGVPSVALACSNWPYGTADRSDAAAASASPQGWQHHHRHHHRHHRNGQHTAVPRTTTSPEAPAAAHPSPSTSAKRTATAPSARKTVTAPRPRTTTAPSAPGTRVPRPATPAAPASAAPSAPKATATASGVTAQVVQLVNAERAKVGCSPLTVNAELTKAAQAHSADMAAHRNMSHTGSDGSSPGDRITGAGYDWSSYGENVAYGYGTPAQVMAGWMNSPGHRANILNCSFKEIGVGFAGPGSYWTQDFGTAR